MILSQIISLQLVAHLALIEIPYTNFTQIAFDLLIKVVTFDLLDPQNYITWNFVESKPWNERFEYLDYGSANFVENFGSLLIFFFLLVFQGMISMILFKLISTGYLKSKCCNSIFSVMGFKHATLNFFIDTFFELLTCSSISFMSL